MTGVIIALVSGILMSVQGVFNTQVTKQTSLWVSAGWVQFTALLVCIGAWFFTGRQEVTALFQVTPRYVLLGGVIGRDHHYCNPEHEQSGTGAVGDADRHRAADRRMADRTVRMVWNGEDQL